MKQSPHLWTALALGSLLLIAYWRSRRARLEATTGTILPKTGITAEQMAVRVEANEANAELLKYFRTHAKDNAVVAETPPPTTPVYGMGMCAHPDIVNHVYTQLNAIYLGKCDWSVYNHPALIHPETGFIFAIGIMMSATIRLNDSDAKKAVKAGAAEFFHENYRSHWPHDPPAIPGEGWVVINDCHALAGRLYQLAYENARKSPPRETPAGPKQSPLWDQTLDG